jgi:hypothetical protein
MLRHQRVEKQRSGTVIKLQRALRDASGVVQAIIAPNIRKVEALKRPWLFGCKNQKSSHRELKPAAIGEGAAWYNAA